MEKVWKLKLPSPLAPQLARETGVSVLEAQLLINRGLSESQSASSFLTPRLADLIDPMLLVDMAEGIELILAAINAREKIAVYGDFDADGLTAAALLHNFFLNIGIAISCYIPNRLSEGYGLNETAIKGLSEKGIKLIITVDCGTSAKKEIALAHGLGMKVVVTDHHQIPDNFQPLCPVINPHRPGSAFPFKNLAGVGLAFYLSIALRTRLRELDWFIQRPKPDLKDYLDLVALGSVADMAPLLDQNRILVRTGLERIENSIWPGIRAIQEVSDLKARVVTSGDLAFRFAPRLNASGRLGDEKTGLAILTTESPAIARELANKLNHLNIQRQAIERKILEEIEEKLESMADPYNRRTLVFYGNEWHKGVLGIVASKLVDRYHRPALILGIQSGLAVGSGRSINGFDIYRALSKLGGYLERFGGHYHAAGLTLQESNIDAFAEAFEALAQEKLSEEQLIPSIELDGEVRLDDLTMEALLRLESFAPFGSANPEPLFFVRDLEVTHSRVVGERHLKMKVRQGKVAIDAIGFGLASAFPLRENINVVCAPGINRWQGYETVQLRVVDLEKAGGKTRLMKLKDAQNIDG